MTPVGILLAAGRGSRFDPSGLHNKLLVALPDGDTVVAASARHLKAATPYVIAVVRQGDEAVAAVLRAQGCVVVPCPQAGEGMAASLVQGVRASLPAPFGWVVALGDMPWVQPSTIVALCDAVADGASIAAPVWQGRRGNPVAFAPEHREALLALHGDEGARSLLARHPVTLVEVDDAGIARDVDAPSDLT